MVFQASASGLRFCSMAELFLDGGQLLKNERRMRIGGQLLDGVFIIALGSEQVAAGRIKVALDELIARSGGQGFQLRKSLPGFVGLSLKC